jgi:hypothetical protein
MCFLEVQVENNKVQFIYLYVLCLLQKKCDPAVGTHVLSHGLRRYIRISLFIPTSRYVSYCFPGEAS